MAKKKNRTKNSATAENANESAQEFALEMEVLSHKYADYYPSFAMYDKQRVFYPVYKTMVKYQISKVRPLHPVIAQILKIVKELQTLKNVNIKEKLFQITQLDSEIYAGILSELLVKGLLTDEDDDIKLSERGSVVLEKQSEIVKEDVSAFVAIDGVFGRVLDSAKSYKELYLSNKAGKDSIELKPKSNTRARTEGLFEEFSDDKTLHQVLFESLNGLDGKNSEVCEINEILDTRKFFKPYFCFFYVNEEKEEKILALDERYEIDYEATALFDELLGEQGFDANTANQSKALNENREKLEKLDTEQIAALTSEEPDLSVSAPEIDLEPGSEFQVSEHKRYFNYVLKHAQKRIGIQSPWVRGAILEIYKEGIEAALKRGVKIYVKYGIHSTNSKNEKTIIDRKAERYFTEWKRDFKGLFNIIEGNIHKKCIVCDDEFLLGGSFNWLSFSGDDDREESSFVITNEKTIKNKWHDEFKLDE